MTDKAKANAALATQKANAAVQAAGSQATADATAAAVQHAAATNVAVAGMKEDADSAKRQLDRAKAQKEKDIKRGDDLKSKEAAASGDDKAAVQAELKRAEKAQAKAGKKLERKAEKAAEKETELAKASTSSLAPPKNPKADDTSTPVTIVNGNEVPNPGAVKVVNGKTREIHIHIHGPRGAKKDAAKKKP